MLSLNPTCDRLVLKLVKPKEKDGCIIIPENASGHSVIAEVMAMGPVGDEKLRIGAIRPGARVLIERNVGIEVRLNSDDYLCCEDERCHRSFERA